MTADDSLTNAELIDGRYRILECVGRGGMAQVYRADDTILGRVVALKMLRTELEGNEASAGRARGEMTALASLNHPALVTLYDAHLVPGRPEYLVMEYVDGPTLAERIADGPLAPGDVAALTADLAEALHVVHSAGIVHRDIKPSNVLLSRAPFPTSRSGAKLADFGISAIVDAARLTTPGIVIGTAAYIAPEQLQGAMPAAPADIYSLGLMMLEALTGTRPFPQAEGIGAALARLNTAPVVPADLGSAWSNLLTAMTASDPGERPTASEVFAAASELTTASARPPRPVIPAAAAAAAAAAAVARSSAADAMAAPTDAVTAAMTTSTGAGALAATGATPSPSSAATSDMPMGAASLPAEPTPTRVLARSAPDGEPDRSTTRRRLGFVGAVAAVAAGAAVLAGAWMAGNAVPEPAATNPADTGPSEIATPTPEAPDETRDSGVVGNTSDDKNSEKDRKAEKEAEKASEEQRKAVEKAQKDAEEAAEDAEEAAEDTGDQQLEEAEPSPGTEPTPDGDSGSTPSQSPPPAG